MPYNLFSFHKLSVFYKIQQSDIDYSIDSLKETNFKSFENYFWASTIKELLITIERE